MFEKLKRKIIKTKKSRILHSSLLLISISLVSLLSIFTGFFIFQSNNPNLENSDFTEDPFYTYITSVTMNAGADHAGDGNINSLDDLKWEDESMFEIEDSWISTEGIYKIDVEMSYDVDLNTYLLDYYDIYLFLEIYPLSNPDAQAEFWTLTENEWVKHCDIVNEEGLSIEGTFLEMTTAFKILSTTSPESMASDGENVIKIDLLRVAIAHSGIISNSFQASDCVEDDIEVSYIAGTDGHNYQADWWVDSSDITSNYINSQSGSNIAIDVSIESRVRLFLNLDGGIAQDFRNLDITTSYYYTIGYIAIPLGGTDNPAPNMQCSFSHSIRNFNSNSWESIFSSSEVGSGERTDTLEKTNGNDYIDYDEITSRYYYEIYFQSQVSAPKVQDYLTICNLFLTLEESACNVEVEGYGFENHNYPTIVQVGRPTQYRFEINDVRGNYYSSSISSIEYLLKNENNTYGWLDADYNVINDQWIIDFLDDGEIYDYEDGTYEVWIKATDSAGYSTLEYYSVELESMDQPLMWLGPIEDETIIFDATGECKDAILEAYIYLDENLFGDGDTDLQLTIDNGIDDPELRTVEGGLKNGENLIDLEPYFSSIDGPITATVTGTDLNGMEHTASRDFVFRKLLSSEKMETDNGVKFIGNDLYAIIYDPNGDRSWASYSLTEEHSYVYELVEAWDDQTEVSILWDPALDNWNMKFGGHFGVYRVEEDNTKFTTITTDTSEIYSTTSWSSGTSNTGPGNGDTYWGEAIYMPYYVEVTKNEYYGGTGSYFEYSNPTVVCTLTFGGEIVVGNDEAPEEWLEQNYVLQARENDNIFPDNTDITWYDPEDSGLGVKTVTGGGRDLHHTHSDTYIDETTHTSLFDIYAGPYLGIISFEFGYTRTEHITENTLSTVKRTYHIEDFDYYEEYQRGDMITNKVGIDDRYGTYIFETIRETTFTTDPWEYGSIDWMEPRILTPEIVLDSNNDGIGPCANDDPVVIVQIEEESGVDTAFIKYSTNGGDFWYSSSLSEQLGYPGIWEGKIPKQPSNTQVLWYVEACDEYGNFDTRNDTNNEVFSYTVVNPPIELPSIIKDSNNDGLVLSNDNPIVSVSIKGEDLIQTVNVRYSIDEGITWSESPLLEQTANPGTWEGAVPAQLKGTTILWYIEVIDNFNDIIERKDNWGEYFSYTIENAAPIVDLISPVENGIYGTSVLVEWIEDDLDGDILEINLYYMEDGGTLWKPICLSVVGNTYSWDVSGFSTTYMRIKIEASDGENVSEDFITNSIQINA